MWTLAAVTIASVHAAYLVFQMLGALLVLRHSAWLWAHLTAVAWGVGIVVVQGSCPATRLERYAIGRSGDIPYSESYLDHYVFGQVLPDGTQAYVYGAHLLVIMATYAFVLSRRSRTSAVAALPDSTATELQGTDAPLVGPP